MHLDPNDQRVILQKIIQGGIQIAHIDIYHLLFLFFMVKNSTEVEGQTQFQTC